MQIFELGSFDDDGEWRLIALLACATGKNQNYNKTKTEQF